MRIAFLNWRDLTHPEGGGAERYAQTICAGLVRRGHEVVLFCAAHGRAPHSEWVDGYRIVRSGGRLGVYPASLFALARIARREGEFDVVIDTQNGLPFWAPLARSTPVVSLIHHVHREQWPVVFGPVLSRLGWWIESKVSPLVYRGVPCVTVSDRSRQEIVGLGRDPELMHVIHNGTDRALELGVQRAERPTIVVLGRLVPHKRVELAIDVIARLRDTLPDVELRVIGDGWWRPEIERHAAASGVSDRVHLLGFVDEATKHRELSRAWLALAPSAKEGWGLNVIEAASHGVPTLAHHGAGGLSESIVDHVTGILVAGVSEMARVAARVLLDARLREELGHNAQLLSHRYTWEAAVEEWEGLLVSVAGAPRPASADVDEAASA